MKLAIFIKQMAKCVVIAIARIGFVASFAKLICRLNEKRPLFEKTDVKTLFHVRGLSGEQINRKDGTAGTKNYILTNCDVSMEIERQEGPVLKSLDSLSVSEIANSVFRVYYTCDSDALPVIKKIQQAGGRFIPHIDTEKTSYRFINRNAHEALKKTWQKKDRISHLNIGVHENICEALELTKGVEGDYVEIGVFLGGSALTALNFFHQIELSQAKKAWLFDTFDGFSYEQAQRSADMIWANTHRLMGVEQTKEYIKETFRGSSTPFELIELNICESKLPESIQKISVANIDVDMYEPTLAALSKCAERMSVGGIMICEDAASTPALYGALLAMNDFLDSETGKCFLPIFKKDQYFLLKLH